VNASDQRLGRETVMELQVRILASDLTAALRTHVEQRLRIRLGGWADRLGRVAVRISDVASTKGGGGKACRISVQLPLPGKTIRRETVDADIYAAIEYATERIGRSVDRELEESEQATASANRPIRGVQPARVPVSPAGVETANESGKEER
jgi:ribosomal subunit interface protein